MSKEEGSPKKDKKNEKEQKLSFHQTVSNNVYAMKLAAKYTRLMVVAAFRWRFYQEDRTGAGQ